MDANGFGYRWNDDDATVTFAVSHNAEDPDTGILQGETLGEVRLTVDQWLDAIPRVLDMLPGKPNAARDGWEFSPVGADPDMIGELIASSIRRLRDEERRS